MSEMELSQESTNTVEIRQEANFIPVHKQKAFIALSVILLAAMVIGAILFIKMSNTIEEQSEKLLGYGKNIESMQNKLTETAEKSEAAASQVKKLTSIVMLSNLQHELEDGAVTDDFYVNKITFIPNEGFNVIIDLDNQPSMLGIYKGQGAYDLPDRELRAKVLAIISVVKESYTDNKFDDMPSWDSATVHLTVQNYDIGVLQNGELKLVGEK